MNYKEKLIQIDELQERIKAFGKLSDDVLKKINYKFRLEWNYHSNIMEGSSLTKSETRSVMVGNITVEGKPIKDILEMKGHDEAITAILKMGKGELNISEKRIKEIHKGIVHEEDPVKKAMVGQWKKNLNYLYNYKGERFDFTAPAEVPDAMHQLINWQNVEKEKIQKQSKDAMHPVMLAIEFHLRYITIHPFHDGNGRTVRIFTNIILICFGYPPIYIKDTEKGPYYQYLADIQGYGGAPDLFYDFIAGLVIRSQQLVLDAIEGKEIEEEDDIDKEIALLKKHLSTENKINKKISKELVIDTIITELIPLYKVLDKKLSSLDEFFFETKCDLYLGRVFGGPERLIDLNHNQLQSPPDNWMNNIKHNLDSFEFIIRFVEYRKMFTGFNRSEKANNTSANMSVEFDDFHYVIKIDGESTEILRKPYGKSIADDEKQQLVNPLVKKMLEWIKWQGGLKD